MLGCLSEATWIASRSNRSRKAESAASCSLSILMATSRFSRRSWARQTLAMAPDPRCSRSSYRWSNTLIAAHPPPVARLLAVPVCPAGGHRSRRPANGAVHLCWTGVALVADHRPTGGVGFALFVRFASELHSCRRREAQATSTPSTAAVTTAFGDHRLV